MGAQISTNLSSGREQRYLNIKSKADLGRYINKSTLMLIYFTTTWCQPCKDAEPPMRNLAEEVPYVKFARVDIDLLQDVVTEFDLKTMPTFLLCKKVDDGLDKGKGVADVGRGNGSGNRISSANNVKGNSVVPSPKRRTVNYAGQKVFIDEIDRMEGPLEGHELRKKIEYYKNQPTTTSFKSTDEFYSYLEKSKPTQLMVINFTTERSEPCKKADEPFKELPYVYKDVKFAKVDVDVDVLRNIAEELDVNVTMMPTFLLVKVKKLEQEHVKKDGVQGDHKGKKEPPEKEHVKKDGVQGDHKGKKEPPVLNKRYKMVKLAQVVGWDDNKERELREMIGKHRYTRT